LIEPSTAIEICRFLHDGALLLLWGAAAFVAFLLPKPLAAETGRRLGRLPMAAAIIALLTTVAALPLAAASIGNGWSDGFDAEVLGAVLFDSTVGVALQAQAAAGLLLLLAFAMHPRSGRMAFVAGGAALGLGALALTGHASMDQGWRLVAHRANDIAHLLSGGAWLGALIPFVIVLKMLGVAEFHAPAQLALRRFSAAGHIAVALVFATGLVNIGLTLNRWPTDWSSPYQLLLSFKIVAVCAMTGLAIVNRYVFVPTIADRSEAAIRSIRLASVMEILLGIAAVGLVAVFGTLDPI
jgi:putative copper resistance protein D